MKHQSIKQLTLSAMMIAIMIILGLFPGIPLGFIPVPIVLQNLGVMMASELLGAKRGFITVGVFLLLALLGFPILSGGHGGAVVFLGPTGGYLMGWLVMPVVMGILCKTFKGADRSWWIEFIMVLVAGVLVVDFCGSLWLTWQSHMAFTVALTSNLAFVPGDVVKAGLAVLIVRRLRKVISIN